MLSGAWSGPPKVVERVEVDLSGDLSAHTPVYPYFRLKRI